MGCHPSRVNALPIGNPGPTTAEQLDEATVLIATWNLGADLKCTKTVLFFENFYLFTPVMLMLALQLNNSSLKWCCLTFEEIRY